MEEGRGPGCLAPSRQYGNALLGARHQEEEQIHGRVAKSRHLSKVAAGCQNRGNRDFRDFENFF